MFWTVFLAVLAVVALVLAILAGVGLLALPVYVGNELKGDLGGAVGLVVSVVAVFPLAIAGVVKLFILLRGALEAVGAS